MTQPSFYGCKLLVLYMANEKKQQQNVTEVEIRYTQFKLDTANTSFHGQQSNPVLGKIALSRGGLL